MKYRIISADCHMDLPYLPSDVFTARLPSSLDGVPCVVETADGPKWVSGDTVLSNWVGPGESAGGAYADVPQSFMGSATERILQARPGSARHRVADLDRDGVDAEVIYGVLGYGKMLEDVRLRAAFFGAYNDYMAQFCSAYPERLFALGQIPMHDPQAAAAEVYRIADLKLVGAHCSYLAAVQPVWHEMWEPLWAAAEETGLPVTFHIEGGFATVSRDRRTGIGAAGVYHSAGPMQLDEALSAVIWSKALENHPGLKVVLGESGVGWIPFLLERMDYQLEDRLSSAGLKMKPSEYWRRQCYATFQKDVTGIQLLDLVGTDNVMWGSDYPHPDGLWPHSQRHLADQCRELPAATRQKILCDNAAGVYGIGR